ncbi:MAG: hypothetical protein AB1646_05950 [Thermodesulfobacteriota bacterium]
MNPNDGMNEGVWLEADESAIGVFHPLLQYGVRVKAEKGAGIKALLCDTMGISAEYLDKRIQTIFLDGKPVDDPGSALLKEGSRIALSAAMPGLVGATLRRGGFFAVMRSQITHRPEQAAATQEPCFVTVRVLNLLIKELAPNVLSAGIWLTREELTDLLDRGSEILAKACRTVRLHGRDTTLESLRTDERVQETELIRVALRRPE